MSFWTVASGYSRLLTWWGFQSLSKMMTVSADCKLRPRPPALVLSKKTKYSEAGSLKVFSSVPRSSALVVPTWHRRWNKKNYTVTVELHRRSESEDSKSKDPQSVSALTVKTQVLKVAVCKVVLHDGHEWGHLTEQQHFVVGSSQLGQDAIQQLKLAGGAVQVGPEETAEETISHICDIFTFACDILQQQMHI